MTDQRYARNDEIREGVDDAIQRRQDQSEAGIEDREQDNPGGANTASGRAERESVVGGHGHGGELEMQLEERAEDPVEGRRDVG